MFQAFTAGDLSVYRELSPSKWREDYDFAAVETGEVVKAEIPHGRPSGMEGFVFNTRRPIFADWRVRDALIHAFNFEFVNQTLNGGALPRRTSYFANSALAMQPGPAEGRVRELLEPFARQPGAGGARRLCAAGLRRLGRGTGRTCGWRGPGSKRRAGRCRTGR